MINIHRDPQKRLFGLQMTFCALAIVLLMQVGARLGAPVVLSGQVNDTGIYGPASSTILRKSPSPRRAPVCKGRRTIKKGTIVCIQNRAR